METVLIEQWLGPADAIEILDEASLTLVRERLRALSSPMPSGVVERAVVVATELGMNQLRHARLGHIAVHGIRRGEDVGIEIVAADAGLGLRDIDGALDSPPREAGSLGIGVGAVRRMASELDLDVRLGEGTCLRARLFDPSVPRAREVGVYGRAFPGEPRSGDHALFVREGPFIWAVLCDGLGHGHEARVASDAAIDVFRERPEALPAAVLEECHERLGRTRGLVMAAVHLAEQGALEISSAGNVEALITGFRRSRRLGGTSATIGGRRGPLKARTEMTALATDDVLVLMTDGIQTRASIQDDPALVRAHPAVIAQRVVERFVRPNDDALVLVVR